MRSRFWKGFFYLLLLPVTLGICGWQGWSWWSWASAPPQPDVSGATPGNEPDKRVLIKIPEGTSGQQIGYDLEAAGLIRSATAWNLWTRWQTLSGKTGGFQAGTYELSPTQPLEEVALQIWNGQVLQSSFTIPEGWSIQQMAEAFEERGFFSADAFVAATRQIPKDQYPWLPANLPHLEGFLYPDTYQLPSEQITAEGIVRLMLDRFEQVALPVYQENQNRSGLTLLEWVTFASIVEKEAVVESERGTIAGVFANRLREGIPLAADPTVEYALGIRQTVEQPLTFAQVATPSPYNTYVNQGLPPTPIASPGLASLEATLYPEPTDYLFFVARYDGTHVFSRTQAEHEAAQSAIRDEVEAQQAAPSDPS